MKRIKAAGWTDEGRGYLKHLLADENALGQKGCLAQLVCVAPRDTVAPHHHKVQTEFYYVLKGGATFTFNGERVEAKPGDAFVCEPCDVHSIINGSYGEDFLFLVFKTNFAEGDIYWEESL